MTFERKKKLSKDGVEDLYATLSHIKCEVEKNKKNQQANALPWRNFIFGIFILGHQFNKTKNMHLTSVILTHLLARSLTVGCCFFFILVSFIITFFQFVSILKPSVERLLCSFSVCFFWSFCTLKSCHAHQFIHQKVETWFLFA